MWKIGKVGASRFLKSRRQWPLFIWRRLDYPIKVGLSQPDEPAPNAKFHKTYWYSTNNIRLLPHCVRVQSSLIKVGKGSSE
jgi:hypothetical protein